MADHSEVCEAFAEMISERTSVRALLIQGASETGKSHMSRQMIRNVMRLPKILCGRFDFKGTASMGVELESFCDSLAIETPMAQTLTEQLGQVFTQLGKRAMPTVVVFDTYESSGEASQWIEKVLLPRLPSAAWLRVVIIGQSVPSRVGTMWESIARPTLLLKNPAPEDWLEYGLRHRGHEKVSLAFVSQAYDLACGKSTILAGLLGPAS
jgi:hypothetical protein